MTKILSILIALLCVWQKANCNLVDDDLEGRLSYFSIRVGFCAKYFQYVRTDDFITGQLTMPNIKTGDTVSLKFHRQALKYNLHFNGSLLPNTSSTDVINRLKRKQPISYRVDFPLGATVPELEKISVNGDIKCATLLAGSGNTLELTHTMNIINDSITVFNHNLNIPHFPETANCGHDTTNMQNNELTPLIQSGTKVLPGVYPWLVAIYRNQTTGLTFTCSGTLLTARHILTAANCFEGLNATEIVVLLGPHNLRNTAEDGTILSDIEEVILHPEDYDLALLKMSKSVSFTEFIEPICLRRTTAAEKELSTVETNATTTKLPQALKSTDTNCLLTSPVFTVISSGLIPYRNELFMLRGITFQKRCGSQDFTVYCDVTKHMSWLEQHINEEENEAPIAEKIEESCGKSDAPNKHPWLAAIYRKYPVGLQFICTGALISSRFVLAAGNCLVDSSNGIITDGDFLEVHLGRHDLRSLQERGVVKRDVELVIHHSDYRGNNDLYFENDLALLHLTSPISFSQYIKPICLGNEASAIVGQATTLLSWDLVGVLDETSAVARSAEIKVVDNMQCQGTGYGINITEPFLCTPRFGNNFDGVLTLESNGRWHLRGISTANDVYWKAYSTVDYRLYSDIAAYIPWIESNGMS